MLLLLLPMLLLLLPMLLLLLPMLLLLLLLLAALLHLPLNLRVERDAVLCASPVDVWWLATHFPIPYLLGTYTVYLGSRYILWQAE